ncbi:hypothetical protein [Aliarcobacter trophiarum]|uniref:hypothetical protein n=1 Tax=Aliarcobacter trophiarum TaxID=708186 RepID=UPI00100BDB48|nr:hypothetical protein [Aliarcobacter trophiarum]RXI27842.1 hypothetical protein CRU89_03350 [Aliarcobacter trophiarum]
MKKGFLYKIKKNEVSNPFHRSFKIEKWIQDFQKYFEEDAGSSNKENFEYKSYSVDEDLNIFQLGLIFGIFLEEIRGELDNLYNNKNPFSTYEEIIKFYFSISNRNKKILLEEFKIFETNLSNKTFNNNFMKNELTAEDIAHGSIDSISNAIHSCIIKMNKKIKLKISDKPISKLFFAQKEAFLSEMYYALENYWNSIILLDYKFFSKKSEDGKTYYIVFQPESEYEKISLISNERREKIVTQRAFFAIGDDYLYTKIKKEFKYIKNSKAFQVVKFSENNKIMSTYLSLLSQEAYLSDFIPTEIMKNYYNNQFNILDILKVFKQLVLLAIQFADNYVDENIEENEFEKLLQFCPIIKKRKLIKSLCELTGYKFLKIKIILKFLEYEGNKNDDLWVNPIISISKDEYILLTGAIDSPNLLRTVERWLVKLNIPLDKRGDYYEVLIVKDFNEVVENNKEIKDFNKSVSKRIKLNNAEEQIDFLCRIGNKILLAETKCIITSDSPQREFNTYKRLKDEASIQVNRKKEFILQDLRKIFEILKWDFNPNVEYEIITFIINSNRTLVGLSANDIPIIDKEILLNYFRRNKFPILSTMNEDEQIIHIAYFILYNNLEEMYKNFTIYLKNPPPIILHKHSFERKLIQMPRLSEESPIIVLSRLIPIKIHPREILEKDYPFKIEKEKEFDEYINKVDFII